MYPILHAQHFEPRRSSDENEGGVRKKMRSGDQLTDVDQPLTQCQSSSNNAKKTYYDCNVDRANRPIRILERRYPLTKTVYKFIDVGVVAVLPTYVNIIIGDCHGKEISMSVDVWKEFIERKQTILAHLFGDVDEETQARASPPRGLPPLPIGNLKIRFGKINNVPILRVETSETRLAISANTVRYMFELEHCINCIVASLRTLTDNVDAKMSRFLAIASAAGPAHASKAIRDSEYFDRNDIIDCELAALCF